ncbi:MAG: hypothetical protein R3D88_03825 [Alphaproteobacteria bacterium]
MFRVLFGMLITLFLISGPAYAGFEWIAPAEQERAAPQPIISHEMTIEDPVVYPAPPVMMEPVQNEPMAIMPPQNDFSYEVQNAVPQQVKNLSDKPKSGLYINPYPLRNQDMNDPITDSSLTDVALVEQGGNLRPVQLGNNMTTGVKAYQGKRSIQRSVNIPTPPTPASSGLTPIPGGEPAPLYEIEKAYYAPSSTISDTPVQYAHAIGFGRDLPLALALSQVIPEGFTHSFAEDVDPGVAVSWEGGEPWNVVLNNMLRPQNMTAIIQGTNITIQPMQKL